MPHTCKDHCQSVLVGGGNDLVIAHRPAGLNDGGDAVTRGFVEAVATLPSQQRTGLGSRVMTAIAGVIRDRFELGALSTGEHAFYERLGWERWRGPSYVRATDGTRTPSADEDGAIMILRCTASREIDLAAPIACDERPGDSW